MPETKQYSKYNFQNCIRGAIALSHELDGIVKATHPNDGDPNYPRKVLVFLASWILGTISTFASASLLAQVGLQTEILTSEDTASYDVDRQKDAELILALMCLIARYTKTPTGEDNIMEEGAFISSDVATVVTLILRMHVRDIKDLQNIFDDKTFSMN